MKKLLMLLCVVLLVACQSSIEEEQYEVLMLLSDMDNPFFFEINQYAVDTAETYSIKLAVKNTENNLSTETKFFEMALEQGIKVLILNPVDSNKSSNIVKLANENNISVILIDRGVVSGDFDAIIRSDNYYGGKLAGNYMKRFGFKNILLIEGIEDTTANEERVSGLKDTLDSDMLIVHDLVANFSRNEAYKGIENNVEWLENIDVIFAVNDEMALGIVDYMIEKNLSIPVIGFDGTKAAIDAVANGYLFATIAQIPGEIGKQSIITTDKLLNKETILKEQLIDLEIISLMGKE